MTKSEFIKHVLIGEIGAIAETHLYLGVSMVTLDINCLGRMLYPDVGLTAAFEMVMATYFPGKYGERLHEGLVEELMEGMGSVLKPKILWVTETRDIEKYGEHLEISSVKGSDGADRINFISEEFTKDYIAACTRVLEDIGEDTEFLMAE